MVREDVTQRFATLFFPIVVDGSKVATWEIVLRYAVAAYVAWGFVPAFWKLLGDLPTLEIICNRIFWTLIFYSVFLTFRKISVTACLEQPRKIWLLMSASAFLLVTNWCLFVYAVNSGQVIEISLGYFINPLFNVALGVVFLNERLSRIRWAALAIAATGVILLTVQTGHLPWIALGLSGTFGLYGFVRKVAPVDNNMGGQMEILMMIVPMALIGFHFRGAFHFLHYTSSDWLFLVLSGLVTSIPLLLFAEGAQIVPLNLLGFLQYITPTIQFFLGVAVFGEHFGHERLVGYGLIWTALFIFGFDLWQGRFITTAKESS